MSKTLYISTPNYHYTWIDEVYVQTTQDKIEAVFKNHKTRKAQVEALVAFVKEYEIKVENANKEVTSELHKRRAAEEKLARLKQEQEATQEKWTATPTADGFDIQLQHHGLSVREEHYIAWYLTPAQELERAKRSCRKTLARRLELEKLKEPK